MKKIGVLVLMLIAVISCKKQSELQKEFNCKSTELSNLKQYSDFKNNFKLSVPTSWKTSKYYTETSSEIFSADTIKQLSETYILNVSYALGTVNFDADFHQKTDSIITQNGFEKIKSGSTTFINSPSYWYVLKGEKNGYTYHQFNIISKKTEMAYFSAAIDIYGDLNIDDRICESLSLLEKIEFLQ